MNSSLITTWPYSSDFVRFRRILIGIAVDEIGFYGGQTC
jgi:hypothetical protein